MEVKYTYILIKQLPHQYTDIYKNNHTTSTKCQYQAAASNPKWWEEEKWNNIWRKRQIEINVVPIITWIPWNPVAIKKQEP